MARQLQIETNKRGYIFPMILLATLSVGMFILTLSRMQISNKTHFAHLNEYQRAFNIASSVLVEVLAELQEKQWNQRSFKDGPVGKTTDLFGGTYNLLTQDADPDKYLFDAKIRVLYAGKYYLFYWRLQYVPDLLDFTRLVIPIYFGQFPNLTGTMDDFNQAEVQVNKDLQKRKENLDKATDVAREIDKQPTVGDSIKVVGIDSDGVKGAAETRPSRVDPVPAPDSTAIMPVDEVVTMAINNIPGSDGFIAFNPPQPGSVQVLPGEFLRARDEPWGNIVIKYPPGSNLSIIGEQEDWFVIVVSGARAFVHQNYVSIPGRPASRIPPIPPSP